MLRVGLTGGIGAGKSTVARRLRELGAVVIDADAVAREVVEVGTPALGRIAERFGDHLLRPDGSLDRAALAAVVFPDPEALRALEAITGPAIAARAAELRAAAGEEAVTVYDMPLLVETGLWVQEHLTLVVGADRETRLRRLVEQRGLDEKDVRHRMDRQAGDEQRRAVADVWVDNSGDPAATRQQVDTLWAQRLTVYDDNLRAGRPASGSDRRELVPADPRWADQGARLVAKLRDALGERALSVKHVGPTSVPGRAAPDVIDLEVGVRRRADADSPGFVRDLRLRGFLRVDGEHGRRYVSADPGRAAQLQVRETAEARTENSTPK